MALTRKQEHARALLAKGYPRRQVCETAGVHPRTLERWLSPDPDVGLPLLREAAATGKDAGGDPEARDVLRALLHDPDPNVRLRAATALLRDDAGIPPEIEGTGSEITTIQLHVTQAPDGAVTSTRVEETSPIPSEEPTAA